MNIILGSASPRRKMILGDIFGDIETLSPSVDESIKGDESPERYTERITLLKMDQILKNVNIENRALLITSDTIVSIDGLILGKPGTTDEAYSMLRTLSGREHYVITGLSIAEVNNGAVSRFYDCEKTSVKFKDIDDDVIMEYTRIVDCSDKAGSYAIQERGDLIVETVKGSITNVIGFPLRLFFRMLSASGLAEVLM